MILHVGSPIWKVPNLVVDGKHTNTLGLLPVNAGASAVEFCGVTIRDGETIDTVGRSLKVVKQGVVLARVHGPVAVNDVVGKSDSNDYMVKDSAVAVGKVLQVVDVGTTALVKVQIGTGGGGSTDARWS